MVLAKVKVSYFENASWAGKSALWHCDVVFGHNYASRGPQMSVSWDENVTVRQIFAYRMGIAHGHFLLTIRSRRLIR